jgi:hypothetical protein
LTMSILVMPSNPTKLCTIMEVKLSKISPSMIFYKIRNMGTLFHSSTTHMWIDYQLWLSTVMASLQLITRNWFFFIIIFMACKTMLWIFCHNLDLVKFVQCLWRQFYIP